MHVRVTSSPASNDGFFAASRIEPDHPWVNFVARSLQRSSNGKPAIMPSSGGSFCNEVLTDTLGMPTIWIPHSDASCSQHAPGEHILMPMARSAIGLMAGSTGISARARACRSGPRRRTDVGCSVLSTIEKCRPDPGRDL